METTHEMNRDFAIALSATRHFISISNRTNRTPFADKIASAVGITTVELFNLIDSGEWETALAFWGHPYPDQKPRGYKTYKKWGDSICKPENKGKERNNEQRNNEQRNQKETLYERQHGKCYGCLVRLPIRILTVDHIVPRSQGGHSNIDNLQLLCYPCNSLKGTGTHAELIANLYQQEVLSA